MTENLLSSLQPNARAIFESLPEKEQNPMPDIQDLKSADEDSEKIMWLTEEEFKDLLHILRKKPVKSRELF